MVLKSKKGNILDLFGIIVFLVSFAIIVIVGFFAFSEYQLQSADQINDTRVADIHSSGEAALLAFDGLFLFVFVGLIIFTAISAFFIPTHPAFFFAGVLMLVLAVMVGAQISNFYETFRDTPQIAAASSQFSIMTFILDRLPFLLTIAGGIIMIMLYTRFRRGG